MKPASDAKARGEIPAGTVHALRAPDKPESPDSFRVPRTLTYAAAPPRRMTILNFLSRAYLG